MANPGLDSAAPHADTRQRLLDAAGEIFAERGFHDATIREICQRAGANVAAVNYHFRDKEGLYSAVLKYAQDQAMARRPIDPAAASGDPRAALHAFVRAFMLRIYDAGRHAWHGRLLAREMVEPTGALDVLVEQNIRPQAAVLQEIVGALLGPGATAEQVRACAVSIVGQCLYYHNCRPVIERLFPDLRYDPPTIDRLAHHITEFSLGGVRAIAAGAGRGAAAVAAPAGGAA